MKTSKPFATISYNTTEFLVRKLDELIMGHYIEFYAFIKHLPEEDESKAHKHLYIVPSSQIDTEKVRDLLVEIDPSNLLKPLRCLPCKKSQFADWLLYGMHDKQYLASKGQARKYSYTLEEFVVSDNDFFLEEYHTIDRSKYNGVSRLVNAVESGKTFEECVISGLVPLQQFVGYEKAYTAIMYGLSRAGRLSHTPIGEEEYINEDGVIDYDPSIAIMEDLFNEKKTQASKPKGTK